MTNCNYSEHTKIQRKEIQKQIEELQAKLEELEKQEPQMTLVNSGDCDIVSYNHKYYYRMGFSSTGHSWRVRGIGHTDLIKVDDPEILVKLEQLYEDMILDTGGVVEQGIGDYDPGAKFRKQEEVKKLQKKPTSLYECVADWWDDVFTAHSDLNMEKSIESLVKRIIEFLPDEINEPSACDDWGIPWDLGYNGYREHLLNRFNGKWK